MPQKALAGVDAPDDMRIKLALALIAYAQNKPADAKAQVDQVLATQPDQRRSRLAMYKKLETVGREDRSAAARRWLGERGEAEQRTVVRRSRTPEAVARRSRRIRNEPKK